MSSLSSSALRLAVFALCCVTLLPAVQLHSRIASSRVLSAPLACRQCAPLCMCAEGEAEAAPAAEAAPEEAAAKPRSSKARTPIEELEVGSTVEGKIRSVQTYGAFVDLGASTDGLLHVSEMSADFVKDANEMFKAGDSVSVRIKKVDLEKKQVALSCKDESAAPRRAPRKARPDLSEYSDADPKAFVSGKVNSIQSYGAFVTLKEGVDGLVHISAIQEGGVSSVEDALEVGQEVQVRIVSFDKEKRRIGLSMKPYVEGEEEEKSGGGRGERRERRPRGGAFDEDDSAFQLSAEELSELGFDYDDTSEEAGDFAAAFARAANVQAAKAQKAKYDRVAL